MALTDYELMSLETGDVVEHKIHGRVTVTRCPSDRYVTTKSGVYSAANIVRIVSRAADKPRPGPAERCLEAHLAWRKASKAIEDAMIELMASSPEEMSKYTELLRQTEAS